MRILLAALVSAAVFCTAALAQPVKVGPGDRIVQVLQANKDRNVTLRLRGGQEFTGTVRDATANLVVLGAISGREFFDAVIPLEAIDAILLRSRPQ